MIFGMFAPIVGSLRDLGRRLRCRTPLFYWALTGVCVMYILKYMKYFSMAEARANFAKLIDSAEQTHERVVITRNGEPAAIILGIHDYEGMEDLIEIYSNPELQKSIQEALDYNDAHPKESVTAEEMRRILDERWAREAKDDSLQADL